MHCSDHCLFGPPFKGSPSPNRFPRLPPLGGMLPGGLFPGGIPPIFPGGMLPGGLFYGCY